MLVAFWFPISLQPALLLFIVLLSIALPMPMAFPVSLLLQCYVLVELTQLRKRINYVFK